MNNKLYHVTFLYKLDSISENGLIVGNNSSFGGSYQSNSSGRIFLTEFDGLSFWFSRFENLSTDKSDDPASEGVMPVVLEVEISGMALEKDEIGTDDASHDAFFTTENIESDRIKVYTGARWEPVETIDYYDLRELARNTATEIDGELYPEYSIFNPS